MYLKKLNKNNLYTTTYNAHMHMLYGLTVKDMQKSWWYNDIPYTLSVLDFLSYDVRLS